VIARSKVRRNGTSTDPTAAKEGYGIAAMTVFPRSKPGKREKS
jgi:hypothetical protein